MLFINPFTHSRAKASAAGARDAMHNLPSPDEPVSGYLEGLEKWSEAHLLHQAELYKRRDSKLKQHIAAGIGEREREGKLLRETESVWSERGIKPAIPAVAHWVVIVLLFAGEFALNQFAFRDFEKQWLQTLLMTFAVGVAVLGAAHILGSKLRKPKKSATDITMMIAALALAGAVAWAVSWARTNYVEVQRSQPVVDSSFNRHITPANTTTTHTATRVGATTPPTRTVPVEPAPVHSSFSMEFSPQALAFLIFQIAIFLVAVFTAYESYDAVGHQRKKYDRAASRLSRLAVAEGHLYDTNRAHAERFVKAAEQMQAAYIDSNLRGRDGKVRGSQIHRMAAKWPEIFEKYKGYPIPVDNYAHADQWALVDAASHDVESDVAGKIG